jgi:hypothetical protein
MASSGNPPRDDQPGEDAGQPPSPWGAPSPGGEAAGGPPPEDDPPLPSWYKAPEPPVEPDPGRPAVPETAPSSQPSRFSWNRPGKDPATPAGAPPAAAEEGVPAPVAEPPPGTSSTAVERGVPARGAEPPAAAEAADTAEPAQPDAAAAESAQPGAAAPTTGDAAPLAAAPTTGDAAPLAAAAAAADGQPPSRAATADDLTATAPNAAQIPTAQPQGALAPPAVADAWTTRRDEAAATPRWAIARREHPHVFGDRIAAGVLLTLAAASMVGGGIYALVIAGGDISPTIRAVICGVAAAVLLAGAILLRLLRGSEDLRGTFAVTGIAFAAACIVFAYNPDPADNHDLLIKFALATGVVAVLSWFAAVVVPSAVAGMLGVVALATAAGAGVWLGLEQPTHIQVFVAAIGVGLALALLLPRLALLRPHPAGLGWAIGGVALVVAFPAIELMARNDALGLAAGATASAAMLAVAQRHRNLPAALAAFAGLAYLELLLVSTRTGGGSGAPQGTQLIIFVIIGVVLVVLVGAAAVLQGRTRPAWPPRRRLPVGVADLLLVAALALSIIALFSGGNDVQLTPTQLQPGTTATHVAPPPISPA